MFTVSHEQKLVEQAKGEVVVATRRSRVLAVVLLALLLIAGIVFVAQEFIGSGQGLAGKAGDSWQRPFQLLAFGAGACILVELVMMFADALAQRSPFTRSQAKRAYIVGLLFAACAIAQAFVSVGEAFAAGAEDGTSILLIQDEIEYLLIFILLIVASIVCFIISYTIKYGSYLQWLYDETV